MPPHLQKKLEVQKMLNNETRVAMELQKEKEAWISRRVSDAGLGSISKKETSFCGQRIRFRGCVPKKHAVEMARLNRKTYD